MELNKYMFKPKVLFIMMLYDYGIKKRGFSYGYYQMGKTLEKMLGSNFMTYDYLSIYQEKGKQFMNENIVSFVKEQKPDLTVVHLFTDEFIPETLNELRKYTKTVCYFWDDVWREQYAVKWAPYFDYLTTPDFNGVKKWSHRGFNNVLYSPYGVNHDFFVNKQNKVYEYDVSFVGMYHPYREWMVKAVQKLGLKVKVVGNGWENGFVSYEQIVEIFNKSKINLNLSNSVNFNLQYMFSSPRALKNSFISLSRGDVKNREQLKGRMFEIPSCGGFQLSYYVEGLESTYEIGKEIVVFNDVKDLIEKVKYYLKYEDERDQIASLGYLRTIKGHTYEHRFEELMKFVGIKYEK